MNTGQTHGIFSSGDVAEEMAYMISGKYMTQIIYVAAEIGIADRLVTGPKSTEELARETGSHPQALYRVLRALASLGIFEELGDRRFALNDKGEMLRSDGQGSLRNLARFYGSPWHNRGSANIMHSVRTNQSALTAALGEGIFDHLQAHPEDGEAFWQAMSQLSDLHAEMIPQSYDFSSIHNLVDVGAGHGHLLTAILKRHPAMRGVLFDLPIALEEARSHVAGLALADRCRIESGDFFDSVPEGGDAYMMKWVLHDWDDHQAQRILRNCVAAMKEGGRVLVIESVMPAVPGPAFIKLDDIEMMVSTDGCERTEAEFRSLFEAAGLALSSIRPTQAGLCVIEGVRS